MLAHRVRSTRRIRVLALALTPLSCISRDLSRDLFACASGGTCMSDGSMSGEVGPSDGGAPDADLSDEGVPDFGPLPPSCMGAMPIPSSGLASGTNAQARDNFQGTCGMSPGGRDVLFALDVPGDLAELIVSTRQSTYDTVLYIFRGDCNATSQFACNDDAFTNNTSFLRLHGVPKGAYYIVVDAFDANANGTYDLELSGTIALGEVCDPTQAFLDCDQSFCQPDPRGIYRCQRPLDCTGADSAQCQSPPSVTCPADLNISAGTNATLVASASAVHTVAYRRWSVLSQEGDFAVLLGSGRADTTSVSVALAGTYVVRYTAVDDLHQQSTCQVTVNARANAGLRLELYWDSPPNAFVTDLDIHLLDPTAASWFDPNHDCYYLNCTMGLPWGGMGAPSNPRNSGERSLIAPEWIEIPTPVPQATYRTGALYAGTDVTGPANASLRVICNGQRVRTLGPTALPNGTGNLDVDNSFWRAADITITATSCRVTPIVNMIGAPSIVSSSVAHAMR
jgi:hypothetical protein